MISNGCRFRASFVYAFFLLSFGLLYTRLVTLQVFRHEDLLRRGLDLHRLNLKIDPRRGRILDCRGRPFAMSERVPSLYAVPEKIGDPAAVARALRPYVPLPDEELLDRLRRRKKFVWLARKLDADAAAKIERLGLEGIGFREETRRVYPQGGLLAHVIGFTDVDNKGLEGIELSADEHLRGQAGWMASHRDRKGREIMTLRRQEVPPIDGYDVVLTVDSVIQHIAESELEEACARHNAIAGCLIVMEPGTGAVLALANWPSYDPNEPARSPQDHRRNRCVTDVYEPGSTFKIVTVGVALDEGAVTLADTVFCENGAFRVGRHTLHDVHAYGTLTTAEVVQKSSNIGAVKIAMKLGERRLHGGIERFGFGAPTGIGLPGEVSGMLHPPHRWSGLSIAAVPMGHEVGVTPIQMAAAAAAIANGGLAMRPYIVREILDASGGAVRTFLPQPRGRVMSEAAAAALVSAMERVASREGTAARAALEEYTVAGKTGTSQKIDPGGRYSRSRFIGSFLGFAPARDPSILVLAVLDEPRPAYYGGVVAAPVFKAVAARTLKYLGVPPDRQPADATALRRAAASGG
ncbi:MAG: penicillin-binding protein 2 [bacterium]|nr:penicillin-binding protein 2 [bacterium]